MYTIQIRHHSHLALCTCCVCFAKNMMMICQQFPRIRGNIFHIFHFSIFPELSFLMYSVFYVVILFFIRLAASTSRCLHNFCQTGKKIDVSSFILVQLDFYLIYPYVICCTFHFSRLSAVSSRLCKFSPI